LGELAKAAAKSKSRTAGGHDCEVLEIIVPADFNTVELTR
jgi:hypothetical protein